MRSSFPQLPPELLLDIFELACEKAEGIERASGWEMWQERLQRQAFLRTMCSVCSTFTEAGQRLLWSELVIAREEVAQRLRDSPALGRYASGMVLIWGCKTRETGVKATTAKRLLAALRGVQHLRLSSFRKMDGLQFDMLSAGSLSGLSSLTLKELYFHHVPNQIFPFRLAAINFENLRLSSKLDIYSPFACKSLTSLKVDPRTSKDLQYFLQFFPHVAGRLRIFDFDLRRTTAAIIPMLESCVELRELRIAGWSNHVQLALQSIPSQLSDLTIHISSYRSELSLVSFNVTVRTFKLSRIHFAYPVVGRSCMPLEGR